MKRVLEPEVMDTPQEARDYNDMDHAEANQLFVEHLTEYAFNVESDSLGDVLDVGTGTALIPVALCREVEDCRVMAIDMAANMLDLGRYNIEVAGLIERITLAQVDAKAMEFEDGMFDTVISNSIIHHIPEPMECLKEMVRVVRGDEGLLFVRDLMRPADDATVQQIVQSYAGEENDRSQKMFEDSLRAALTLDEIREMVVALGFDPETVHASSDRHWTWAAVKP